MCTRWGGARSGVVFFKESGSGACCLAKKDCVSIWPAEQRDRHSVSTAGWGARDGMRGLEQKGSRACCSAQPHFGLTQPVEKRGQSSQGGGEGQGTAYASFRGKGLAAQLDHLASDSTSFYQEALHVQG